MRCEHADHEHLWNDDGTFKRDRWIRCREQALWVWRGHWYCDDHTRALWVRDLSEHLWTPRSTESGQDPEARVPTWVPETLRSLADQWDARTPVPLEPAAQPAQPNLFEEVA